MKINYLFPVLSMVVFTFFSCEKEDEISLDNNGNTLKEDQIYLRGVERFDQESFINVKSDENYQPTTLYFSNSLENDIIASNSIISETEYSENGKVKSYKQQVSDLNEPVFYTYYSNKVDFNPKEGASSVSSDLPYAGEGITTVYDFNEPNPFVVNSLGSDTIFYEITNGNVTRVSNIEHLLYEYTYDNKPYFGKGIIYDFFSSEFDFQWWFIPEFVPNNNITSIKKYVYADSGIWTPNEDEVYEYIFTYEYNEYNYPTQIKTQGETWMKFHYLKK